jgi:hypothetical protein
MLEKLKEIDTSAIEKLTEIKNQQDLIKGYLKKAGEQKAKVDIKVYQIVRNDYENRHKSLEQEAEPLKAEARKEYKKLSALYEKLTVAFDEARIGKEELEFRHSVGELSDDGLAEQLKDSERKVEQCQTELAEADKLKERFLTAFHSKEELEEGAPDIAESVTSERVRRDEDFDAKTVVVSPEELSQATRIVPPGGLPPTEPVERPEMEGSAKTVVLREATLTTEKEGDEYRLGPLNEIGRGLDNHIKLSGAGVSKKHALITASPNGFTIKDMKSRYGTFVNDEKITECNLADGDRIRIGELYLIFKMP